MNTQKDHANQRLCWNCIHLPVCKVKEDYWESMDWIWANDWMPDLPDFINIKVGCRYEQAKESL